MEKVADLLRKNTLFFLLASLTLGLAPFSPEPHIVGKIRWVMGGSVGMGAGDWFDLLMHGTPFVLLLFSLILRIKKTSGSPKKT